MYPTKQMDHAGYPKALKHKTEAELRFIISDAKGAIAANPDNPNNGYYQDEICYCAGELHRREF